MNGVKIGWPKLILMWGVLLLTLVVSLYAYTASWVGIGSWNLNRTINWQNNMYDFRLIMSYSMNLISLIPAFLTYSKIASGKFFDKRYIVGMVICYALLYFYLLRFSF